jgi:outer membrane protein assembly factor BamB
MKNSTFLSIALALAPAFVVPLHAAKPAKKEKTVAPAAKAGAVHGWLDWRGPTQDGISLEKGLPEKADSKAPLWTADLPGQSAPVIANGRLFINGYSGTGADLQEILACFDADSGKKLWEHRFNDFLSDTVYDRYSTSSPAIDPETGNVYVMGTQGLFSCFTPDGKLVWQHSMMEEFGRLTFPNSRTASPLIDKELVITRGITSAWGAYGPAGDRFYAFDKKTGELVWSSAPGERPQDNTFSHPYLTFIDGKRVLFSAGGDSTLVAINARTGDPLMRMPVAKAGAKGGINAAVVRYKDSLIVIHESENIDSSEVGRSAAFKIPQSFKQPEPGKPQPFEAKELELWRNPAGNLASSPVVVGDRLFEVSGTGEVVAINAGNGETLWKKKLAPEQRQSSPLYADGKLYVAMYVAGAGDGAQKSEEATSGDGELFILKPGDKDAEILSRTVLQGRCFGSPVAYNGKLYIQTDKKLYCFGKKGENKGLAPEPAAEKWPAPGVKTQLQVIPFENLLQPGQSKPLRVRALDVNGFTVEENLDAKAASWATFIPPTALVKATMKGEVADGAIKADPAPAPSAGVFKGTIDGIFGLVKGRVMLGLPITQDFESFELSQSTDKPPAPAIPNTLEPPTAFAYPPLPWNGARFRFEVRQAPGEGSTKALCKTIENKLFQRGQVFFGHPDLSGYTAEADLMTEGNKRKMSEVGLINQRYLIVLKGNAQQIEISSNQERIRESVPFKWAPNEWYHLKTRVDVAADGSGTVRAKAWKKGEPEPEAWAIEVKHAHAHTHGSPGLFSFTPQEQRAWIDNLSVTPNK